MRVIWSKLKWGRVTWVSSRKVHCNVNTPKNVEFLSSWYLRNWLCIFHLLGLGLLPFDIPPKIQCIAMRRHLSRLKVSPNRDLYPETGPQQQLIFNPENFIRFWQITFFLCSHLFMKVSHIQMIKVIMQGNTKNYGFTSALACMV